MPGNSVRVFISHASQDRRIAETLCAALEARGLNCWLARRDVAPGENFQAAIVRAIRGARIMLLAFTANANHSDGIKKELALASQDKLVIIPLRMENAVPDDAFAFELATRQWVDMFEDWERGIEQIVARISALPLEEGGLGSERSSERSPGLPAGARAAPQSPGGIAAKPEGKPGPQRSAGDAAPAFGGGQSPEMRARVPGTAAGVAARTGLPDRPTLMVLPFQNLSGDPEQDYFVDGVVEEIITALSRIRWLFVIARNTSFTYKGRAIDIRRVGREVGVRYVLEGSVRKSGQRVRITGQLIETGSGAHVWADRFDGLLEDVFELQDRVAASVAGVIEPALQAAETARTAARSPEDLTTYDLYLRAYAMYLSSAKQIPEALRLMEQAIARDPGYGPALAWAAICCCRLLLDDRSEDRAADSLKGADYARRALEVAGDDPGIIANAAFALAFLGEDIGAMMSLVDRALALNPNYARGWYISGTLRLYAGETEIAIAHLETSIRLSPLARTGPLFATLGAAYLFDRRFDEAVPKLRLAIQEDPNFPDAYRLLAACYAHMGRLDEAREILARLRAITPLVTPRVEHLRNVAHREVFYSGLRLAVGEAA